MKEFFTNLVKAASKIETQQYLIYMHLSQLFGLVLPVFGFFIAPLILWLLRREDENVSKHFVIILNWLLSLIIYSIISALLILAFIGIIFLIILTIAAIVLPIVAAIQIYNKHEWEYPLSLKLIKWEDIF